MTALGKMMVIFVFLLSLVWVGLVVNTWATRTNWKAEAEKQSKIAKENYEGAKSLAEQSKAERAALEAKVAAMQANVERLQQQNTEEHEQKNKIYSAYEAKLKGDRASDGKIVDLTTEIAKLQNQVDVQSTNLKTMEADLNAQVRDTERNKNLKDEAVRSANESKERADSLTVKLQNQQDKMGAGGAGNVRPLAPEGFRGTVTGYEAGFIKMTPGLNSGLKPGMTLMVRRSKGDKNFIGTILLGDIVDPADAVGTWTAPSYVKKPTGDDFPQAGDEIVPLQQK